MSKIALLLIFLSLFSCKSVEKSPCNSDFYSRSFISDIGLRPIEFTSENEVYRVWIYRSSSVSEVITIYKDSADYFADYVEYGFGYEKRLIGQNKKVSVYNLTEICPVQGWANFMEEFQMSGYGNLKDRINDKGYGMLHHGMTKYLVEIKRKKEIKRFEFFSFFPSPVYPDGMEAYKGLEKLIYTSF